MILTQALIPYDIVARPWKDGGFHDSYAWHKRIWEAFPNQAESQRDFLTRLDDTGSEFRLLILSPAPPARPGWCPESQWLSKPIAETFFQHPAYHFSLLANPTRKRVVRDADGKRKKNGRREPLVTREDLLAWIARKADLNGFSIESSALKTTPRPRQSFLKKGTAGTHTATEFSGTLAVTDPDLFLQAATGGIGSAKAFGFGMLCLSPL